jgi:hypothetical protein
MVKDRTNVPIASWNTRTRLTAFKIWMLRISANCFLLAAIGFWAPLSG